MVAISNAFWGRAFAAVPFNRRLLLLPKCLSDVAACTGYYDAIGLHCGGCGACGIFELRRRAEELGYQVLIAEGTSSVLLKILDGEADALLGVACLDSLEKSFAGIAALGIPQLAVPLLRDGCADTEAEVEEILAHLHASGSSTGAQPYSCIPLLRETTRGFADPQLGALLAPYVPQPDAGSALFSATDDIALDWLRHGGKRLRPFVTIAAYATARHGLAVLARDAEVATLIPPAVRRLALAIEALHKASLVHDDIEDNDAYRYGRETLHRTYGVAPAVNFGDYLVGLGYRLIAGQQQELGSACVADILAHLAAAHLELCRGQGVELLWQRRREPLLPRDVLAIYALKTAPAFEAALFAGLRAADCPIDPQQLKQLATYLGEGYQLLNDLEDWQKDATNKRSSGLDVLSARPTLFFALAQQAGAGARLAELNAGGDPAAMLSEVRQLYHELGIFTRAEHLLDALRRRAEAQSAQLSPPALCELMTLLTRLILRQPARR